MFEIVSVAASFCVGAGVATLYFRAKIAKLKAENSAQPVDQAALDAFLADLRSKVVK